MYNLMFSLMLLPGNLAHRYAERVKNRGQGSLEYVGMIAVAALIIVAVAAAAKLALPDIKAFISTAVSDVKTAVTSGG